MDAPDPENNHTKKAFLNFWFDFFLRKEKVYFKRLFSPLPFLHHINLSHAGCQVLSRHLLGSS